MNTTFNLLSESAGSLIMCISLVVVIIALAAQRTVIHEQRKELEALKRAKRK